MNAVGIICEYNPFHNGHIYHLQKVKERYPDSVIILVVSGPFLQRGEASLLTKWDKAKIALQYGVDICIELPFAFATGSADIFAHGAIQILNHLKVDAIIFGSECNDPLKLTKLALIQTKEEYQQSVKEYLKQGLNYPTALSKAFSSFTEETVTSPNDLLGLSYIKEILAINPFISPITIKRTNNYHEKETIDKITSATSIRNAIQKNNNISEYVPSMVLSKIKKECFIENYFPFLKYKIITEINDLQKYQGVDEKIEARIQKYIEVSDNLKDLIQNIKSKNDTYNKINRILVYILCNYTKKEAQKYKDITYLRLLGFSKLGQTYLNSIKKDLKVPLLTNYSNDKDNLLELDLRATKIYSLTMKDPNEFINQERKQTILIKNNKNEI